MWDLHSYCFVLVLVLNMLVFFALVCFGFVFFFQYNDILDKFENTAPAALPAVCLGVSGTEPKLVPVSSSKFCFSCFCYLDLPLSF